MSAEAVGGGQSVLDRAAALLAAYTAEDELLGPSELGRRTGLPKPTAFRLARQLVQAGLLEHHDGAFRLGRKLFELGHRAPRERTLRERAAPVMMGLRERTGYTISLAELAGPDVLLLEMLGTGRVRRPPFRVGDRLPAHATALGKIMLAHLPADAAVLPPVLTRRTPRTIVRHTHLRTVLTEAARLGFAVDLEECQPGLSCVAAPVLANDGTAVAALSLTGPGLHTRLGRLAADVRAAAAALTRDLAPACPSYGR